MKTRCPHCGFWFKAFAANADSIPAVAAIVCESCGEVGLMEKTQTGQREVRKLTAGELEAVKQSPAWKDFLEPALELIQKQRGKRS